ncbi:hypothetical protein IAT38_002364 [Cryptococcus sp. DSM 104549]
MAAASSSKSAPSKQKSKSKSKAPAAKSAPNVKSASVVDSDPEEDKPVASGSGSDSGSDSESESESGSESDGSENSDDLENVQPRRGAGGEAAPQRPGGKLPKYQPPNGMSELKVTTAFVNSPFEWEALAAKKGVELWAIRAPRDLKPSRLSALNVTAPKGSSPVSGSLKTKSQTYSLTAAGSSAPTRAAVDAEGRQPTAGPGLVDAMDMGAGGKGEEADLMRVEGGEEMEGLRLLVPRLKQSGKLFVAPMPITRRLLLTPDTPIAPSSSTDPTPLPSFLSTSTPGATTSTASVHPDTVLPAKRQQPTHLLKFRNRTYGFDTPGPGATVVREAETEEMELDGEAPAEADVEPAVSSQKKEKKRKSDGKDASPEKAKKKAKKAKA